MGFKERLKKKRLEANLTQAQLAEKISEQQEPFRIMSLGQGSLRSLKWWISWQQH